MVTAIVLSDTHHNVPLVEKLLPLMQEADLVVHLGDGANDLSRYALSLKGKLHRMAGNCDDASFGEREEIIEVEGVRIFACHGHRYGVKQQLVSLTLRAKECNCTVALYGHTHEGRIDELKHQSRLRYPLHRKPVLLLFSNSQWKSYRKTRGNILKKLIENV
jgi:putative phosphoesterase